MSSPTVFFLIICKNLNKDGKTKQQDYIERFLFPDHVLNISLDLRRDSLMAYWKMAFSHAVNCRGTHFFKIEKKILPISLYHIKTPISKQQYFLQRLIALFINPSLIYPPFNEF